MKAVFLDRDGTVLVEKGYVTIPDDVELLPGVAGAILSLRAKGWKAIVVSNQACVAKGLISEEELAGINMRMVMLLGAEGAEIDGIHCCPHHPEGTLPEYAIECSCRKPRPGMLQRAAAEHDLDLTQCVIIGDTMRDLEAGRAVGAKTVLVRTGKGEATAALKHGADHVCANLAAAVDWLLGMQG